ncbi:MAG: glycosyltransferase family 2 protein [Bacillota bacterium]
MEVECAIRVGDEKKLASLIVPTRNRLSLTRLFVESLLKNTPEPVELIFVDNNSTDGTPEYLSRIPGVRVIVNQANLGFAAGCNKGLAVARSDYLVLLNNDIIVSRGWLSRLVAHFKEWPKVGLIGPLSNCAGGEQTIGVNFFSISQIEEFDRQLAVKNSRRCCRKANILSGFCLLLKREVLNAIGGLDPRFGPGNFDDDDYCLRARLAGFELLVAEDVFIYHFGGQTFRGEKMNHAGIMRRNWDKFRQKWGLPANFPPSERYTSLLILGQPFDPQKHFQPII